MVAGCSGSTFVDHYHIVDSLLRFSKLLVSLHQTIVRVPVRSQHTSSADPGDSVSDGSRVINDGVSVAVIGALLSSSTFVFQACNDRACRHCGRDDEL
jgi:hypothetical protein